MSLEVRKQLSIKWMNLLRLEKLTFIKNIKELDSFHGLDLNFERLPAMKNIFERGLELDQIRQECNLVEQVIGHGADKDFGGLDVSTEAFIYATFEIMA